MNDFEDLEREVCLTSEMKEQLSKNEPKVIEGNLDDIYGTYVFDREGMFRGIITKCDSPQGGIMYGPKEQIGISKFSCVGVVLKDGTIQNPDGSKSEYTDPVKYLLDTVQPIRKMKYTFSRFYYRDGVNYRD